MEETSALFPEIARVQDAWTTLRLLIKLPIRWVRAEGCGRRVNMSGPSSPNPATPARRLSCSNSTASAAKGPVVAANVITQAADERR